MKEHKGNEPAEEGKVSPAAAHDDVDPGPSCPEVFHIPGASGFNLRPLTGREVSMEEEVSRKHRGYIRTGGKADGPGAVHGLPEVSGRECRNTTGTRLRPTGGRP